MKRAGIFASHWLWQGNMKVVIANANPNKKFRLGGKYGLYKSRTDSAIRIN